MVHWTFLCRWSVGPRGFLKFLIVFCVFCVFRWINLRSYCNASQECKPLQSMLLRQRKETFCIRKMESRKPPMELREKELCVSYSLHCLRRLAHHLCRVHAKNNPEEGYQPSQRWKSLAWTFSVFSPGGSRPRKAYRTVRFRAPWEERVWRNVRATSAPTITGRSRNLRITFEFTE